MAEKILKCMQCILACFEKLLKFINRNAFIAIAMYGDGFCGGAKHALSLLVSNAQHMAAVNCVGGFCLILGKVAVTVSIGFIGLTWFSMLGVAQEQYFTPLVIACVCSFFVASCFFAVFGIALDTIFLCFCDDQQRNNGQDRPYFSSAFLQKYMTTGIVDNSSKAKSAPKEAPKSDKEDVPPTSAGVEIYPKLTMAKSEYARTQRRQKMIKTQMLFQPATRRNPRVGNNSQMVSIQEITDSDVLSRKPPIPSHHRRTHFDHHHTPLRMFTQNETDRNQNLKK